MALLGTEGSISLQPPGPEGLRDFAVKEKLRKLVYLGEAESGSQCTVFTVWSEVSGLGEACGSSSLCGQCYCTGGKLQIEVHCCLLSLEIA